LEYKFSLFLKSINISSMKLHLAILILLAFVFASCKTSTAPAPASYVPTANNTMYVTVNGVTDTLTASAYDTTYSGVKGIDIAGANTAGMAVNILITTLSSTGSYGIGSVNISPAGYVILSYSQQSSGSLVTYTSPTQPTLTTSSVGTLDITAFSATSIQATFNGTLTLQNGTSTVTITNGGVNATIL
jgi:hypothetical protein